MSEPYRGTRPLERLAWWLRLLADRIDYRHAVRCRSPYTLWWDPSVQRYVVRDDDIGAPIWGYEGDHDLIWSQS